MHNRTDRRRRTPLCGAIMRVAPAAESECEAPRRERRKCRFRRDFRGCYRRGWSSAADHGFAPGNEAVSPGGQVAGPRRAVKDVCADAADLDEARSPIWRNITGVIMRGSRNLRQVKSVDCGFGNRAAAQLNLGSKRSQHRSVASKSELASCPARRSLKDNAADRFWIGRMPHAIEHDFGHCLLTSKAFISRFIADCERKTLHCALAFINKRRRQGCRFGVRHGSVNGHHSNKYGRPAQKSSPSLLKRRSRLARESWQFVDICADATGYRNKLIKRGGRC